MPEKIEKRYRQCEYAAEYTQRCEYLLTGAEIVGVVHCRKIEDEEIRRHHKYVPVFAIPLNINHMLPPCDISAPSYPYSPLSTSAAAPPPQFPLSTAINPSHTSMHLQAKSNSK